jgi:predicted metal-dependent hydrolase
MQVAEFDVEVEHKGIKNVHLAVYPPDGRVHISVPEYMKDDEVSMFLFTKLSWIRKQREKVFGQERQDKREFVSGESHYLFGRRYLLKVIPKTGRIHIEKKVKYLEMYIHNDTSIERRKSLMEEFYRQELRQVLESLVKEWAKEMSEPSSSFEWSILLMQKKWGSCITSDRKIQFNLLLSRVPHRCIEYIVVHEIAHLKEHRHNRNFISILDEFLPDWQLRKKELDEFIALPIIDY